MRLVALGEYVQPVKTWNPRRTAEAEFEYIDLGAIDNVAKVVSRTVIASGSDAPSRARQLVAEGDVLVSTVRPNLNAVARVPSKLDGATASTGFTVLRPDERLDGRFLFYWVQSSSFVEDMVRKATGASYPAVSDRIVKNSQIPMPPVDEQRRIAAILDHADALRTKRRQVLAHLDDLTQSMFHDMFGSPDIAPQVIQFGDVAELVGGRNLVADDESSASKYRVLKISAVTSGQFKPQESKPLPEDYVPPHSHLVKSGDLLMSRANTTELVGAVAQVHETAENLALPDKIWRFQWRDSESSPAFYHALFRTPAVRRRISRLSSGTGGSMKNVSKAKLRSMEIPRISIPQQLEFAKRATHLAAVRDSVARAGVLDDELFASLQSRAFKGEL